MNQPGESSRQSVQDTPVMPCFAAALALFETVIAAAVVVSLFAAASGPFGWPAALQILLCAGLCLLLWLADSRLQIGESFSVECGGRASCHQAAREES